MEISNPHDGFTFVKSSALLPEDRDEYARDNDEYLYHSTLDENIPLVGQHGLVPHDDSGKSKSQWAGGYLEPRPGHVYLGSKNYVSQNYTNPNIRVKLSSLNPENINADEDHFVDKAAFNGIGDYAFRRGGCPSLGHYAHQQDWGKDPRDTESSLRQGSVSHKGTIAPENLEYWSDILMDWHSKSEDQIVEIVENEIHKIIQKDKIPYDQGTLTPLWESTVDKAIDLVIESRVLPDLSHGQIRNIYEQSA